MPFGSVPLFTAGSIGSVLSSASSGAMAGCAAGFGGTGTACADPSTALRASGDAVHARIERPRAHTSPRIGAPISKAYYSAMRLQIKRLQPDIGLPEPATGGAAGFDLAAAADIEIPPRSI